MSQLDEPNMVLPLALSYNERGAGSATSNGIDQRKVNSVYEIAVNSFTGKPTLYLVKRPGAVLQTANIGSVSDIPYIATKSVDSVPTICWICKNGNNIVAKDDAGTSTTVLTQTNTFPMYVDRTVLSGVANIVLQTRRSSPATNRVWYSTTIGTWTEITDVDFTALTTIGKMEHMDGFAFIATTDNRLYNSDLNSIANWTATNYTTKQTEQDFPRGIARIKNMLIYFGMETAEVFVNRGYATGSPLERVEQISSRIGIYLSSSDEVPGFLPGDGARHYYATLGNRIYFVGREAGVLNRSGGVYTFDGARFEKISTAHIDKYLGGFYSHIQAITWQGQKAVAILTTVPSVATQKWLMFFPAWNEWFEWTSTYFQPVTEGRYVLGITGATANDLFSLSADQWVDGDTAGSFDAYTMTHQLKLPKSGNHRQFVRWIGLSGDTATSASTVNVELSRDDYQSFETARGIDMTSKKKSIYRCGSYQGDLAVRLTHTGNVECRLEGLLARID